ncbi:MAG TPA: glycosyltransferase family 4 protein [Terriglobales bacterium]|nr:glycosyltransferase family 4 protein [Terriglobales bacterium]
MKSAADNISAVPATRLAIVATHPIQYHAAWYRLLAVHPELEIHVYYCHRATPAEQANAGFGVEFDWDVPLLSGYPFSFLKNVARVPGDGRFGGFDTPEIKEIIRRHEYDAVMVNGWNYKSAWQAIRACWKTGVKVLVRSDSHLRTPRGFFARIAKAAVYPRFVSRFDGCLAVGKWSREYFLRYGAKPERVFLVPHAVDNLFFSCGAERARPMRSELRKKWGLDPEAIVFAFAGKFIEKKRPMDVVRAVDLAARRGSRLQGLMIGDGPLRRSGEEYVRNHGAPVLFAGFVNQSQIPAAYALCDVLVLPSDGETWGLVVNEAMACGLPAIVSDQVGCGPDLIVARQTGFVFPLGDVEALASQMLQMADNPARLAEMGACAARMINNYSAEAAVDNLVGCLKAILN